MTGSMKLVACLSLVAMIVAPSSLAQITFPPDDSKNVTCYECKYDEAELSSNIESCRVVNDMTTVFTLPSLLETPYCVTVTGKHENGKTYGQRTSKKHSDANKDGKCEDGDGGIVGVPSKLKGLKTCYCTAEKCNNKEFEKSAGGTAGAGGYAGIVQPGFFTFFSSLALCSLFKILNGAPSTD